ncbi:MAG: cation diffusion facilitator family transporter [Hyphomicrobium sp.]|uniref:cation diffusion facilitator family transporter n=1 Tax=Hyphomicrobium sp. TaxID=82 RepID=UPI0039E381A5
MDTGGSKSVIIVAFACNLGIALTKFVAAGWTQSSAMLSEAIHSLVDTSNQLLLLFGIHRAARPADAQHPFGYGKEMYFWSFIVAMVLFSLGAGVAIYEGIEKVLNPHPLRDTYVLYIVLGVALALEGYSMLKALGEFNVRRRPSGLSFVAALRASKDPSLFAIVLEDAAALAGLVIAFVGTMIADLGGYEQADGYASILIGCVLAFVAIFMSVEIRSLIVGEAASRSVQDGIRDIISADVGPEKPIRVINEIRTMHLAPQDILVTASVDFEDWVSARTVEEVTARLQRAIKARYPEVQHLFIEVQSDKAFQANKAAASARAATSAASVH